MLLVAKVPNSFTYIFVLLIRTSHITGKRNGKFIEVRREVPSGSSEMPFPGAQAQWRARHFRGGRGRVRMGGCKLPQGIFLFEWVSLSLLSVAYPGFDLDFVNGEGVGSLKVLTVEV